MKVALLGVSGTMGSCLLEELRERGHAVTGICRTPSAVEARDGVTLIGCDASDADALAPILVGHDAILIALKFLGFDMDGLMAGIGRSGVDRVIMVGHSGTLLVSNDAQLVDTDNMSLYFKPEALDAREAFKALRRANNLAWTYAAPAALLTLGKKTGEFRLGDDRLFRDRLGESRISMQDFAIAIVDELEEPQYVRNRFTAAY